MRETSSAERSIRATFLTLLIVSLPLLAPICPALASTVDVTFSGAFDNGPLNGSSFSGTVTYDTNAAIILDGLNFRQFAMATGALTVTIGGDTVHNTNNVPDDIQVSNFGRLAFQGNTVAGSGPLDGFNATAFFEFSSDPALAALELPFPFPTDWSDPRLAVNSAGGFSSGPITAIDAVNTPSVPAPSAAILFATGVGAFALLKKWRAWRDSNPRPPA